MLEAEGLKQCRCFTVRKNYHCDAYQYKPSYYNYAQNIGSVTLPDTVHFDCTAGSGSISALVSFTTTAHGMCCLM